MSNFLPWIMSALTIWMTLLAGNKHKSAWLIGLFNQALWLVWIISVGAWGLLPMNAALWIVYGRNHLRWASEQGTEVVLGKRVSPKDPQPEKAVEALRPRPAHNREEPTHD